MSPTNHRWLSTGTGRPVALRESSPSDECRRDHARTRPVGAGLKTKSILVVEPDEGVGSLLVAILQEDGRRTTVVRSEREAIAALSHSRFDLIVTEALGQRQPFEFDASFLARLRSRAGDTPIVLCSMYPSTDYLQPGDFGLAAVVPKPFDVNVLLEKAKRLLG